MIDLEASHLLRNQSGANVMSIITWPRSFLGLQAVFKKQNCSLYFWHWNLTRSRTDFSFRFVVLQIISLLMSSVQKLPPEVSKTWQTEQLINIRIVPLVITFFKTFSLNVLPPVAVSFILQVTVDVDRDAGGSTWHAIFYQPDPRTYLGGKLHVAVFIVVVCVCNFYLFITQG